MDYTKINQYLSSLEISSKPIDKSENTSQLSRDLCLNNNNNINREIANPQRFEIQSTSQSLDKESMNSKITNYNFIQKKDYVKFK